MILTTIDCGCEEQYHLLSGVMNRRNIKMEILWEFSKKIGIFWHICGKNIEKIGLGKLKINRKSFNIVSALH